MKLNLLNIIKTWVNGHYKNLKVIIPRYKDELPEYCLIKQERNIIVEIDLPNRMWVAKAWWGDSKYKPEPHYETMIELDPTNPRFFQKFRNTIKRGLRNLQKYKQHNNVLE